MLSMNAATSSISRRSSSSASNAATSAARAARPRRRRALSTMARRIAAVPSVACGAVDGFSDQVRVSVMARVFLDHVRVDVSD
jgi:hypothetical protein